MAPNRAYIDTKIPPKKVSNALKEYEPLMQQLLYTRGITDAESAHTFLNPDYEQHLHDPFLMKDMQKAVERMLTAIENMEQVVIYSDYDCDGIPGGVVLHDFFKAIEFPHFKNYIPHRHHDGYGFSAGAISKLKELKAALIVTVDCGIVDTEAVAAANSEGIDVIITDHHEPNGTLPDAFAILNPKCEPNYPFNGLCGAGVAYKFVQAILAEGKARGSMTLKDGMEKWWLDMVGLATIADRVPLVDENRTLAHYGLKVLRKSQRPGLQHLLQKAGGSQRHLTEEDIGFTIGPRINAASRMDDPEDAFYMLATKDEGEAGERVRHLEKLNNERKGVVAAMTKEAKKKITAMETVPKVIVLGNPAWRPSLVGLVANSIADEYKRPAFLWGRDGNGIIKGSCRGPEGMSLLEIMDATPQSFIGYGGHHGSGGFSVEDTNIHTLLDDLNDAFSGLHSDTGESTHTVPIDADLKLNAVNQTLLRVLRTLAPFGEGNPKPIFRFAQVTPKKVVIFGKANNHTKIVFQTETGPLESIAFFKTPEDFGTTLQEGKPLTLIAHVEESFYRGRAQTRLRIIDIL